jgi:hypothetical protein
MPSTYWFRSQAVPAAYAACVEKLKNELRGVTGLISITSDTWTSRVQVSF